MADLSRRHDYFVMVRAPAPPPPCARPLSVAVQPRLTVGRKMPGRGRRGPTRLDADIVGVLGPPAPGVHQFGEIHRDRSDRDPADDPERLTTLLPLASGLQLAPGLAARRRHVRALERELGV